MLLVPYLDTNKLSALGNSSFSSKSYLVFHRLFGLGFFSSGGALKKKTIEILMIFPSERII